MLERAFRFWPAAVVVVLAGFIAGCGLIDIFPTGRSIRDYSTNPVVIGGVIEDPTFTPDPVTALPLDRIQWTHPFSETVVIELDGVPVTPKRLVLPEGVSGRVMVLDTATAGHYKYTVKVVRAVGDTLVVDPYIDVEEEGRRSGGG